VFTGFRATGKTSVGRELAKLINYRFIDTDVELCDRFNCSISTFVENHGWSAFRDQERQLLLELAELNRIVVATGGGAVMHTDAWNMLRRDSVVIWLKADVDVIQKRLTLDPKSALQRPSLTGEDTLDEIESLLAQREPMYRMGSDIVIDSSRLDPVSTSLELKKIIDNNKIKQ